MTIALRSVDPELGPQRYCRRCDEWWPEDAEFWGRTKRGVGVCRACQREWNRVAHERRLARDPPRGSEDPCLCAKCDGCLTVTPFGVCRFCRRHGKFGWTA